MADRDPRSLERALEALRARVEREQPPADLFVRISARAAEPRRGARRGRWVVAAVAAGAVVLAAGLLWRSRSVELAGFRVAAASGEFHPRVEGGVLSVEGGEASLAVPELALALAASPGARLGREAGGVRVLAGTVAFEVEPRPRAPVAVLVSGGRIEVLGTRFTVVQGKGVGSVRLERGAIRFVDPAGQETRLRPGEQLRWPLRPVAVEAPGPAPSTPPARRPVLVPAPRKPRPRPPALSAAAPEATPASVPPPPEAAAAAQERRVLAEIDRLRIRREDQLLVNRLDEILAAPTAEPLRERLSFERCDVLAHQAGASSRACAEIARHLAAYPGGEYTSRLEQSRRSLGCSQ